MSTVFCLVVSTIYSDFAKHVKDLVRNFTTDMLRPISKYRFKRMSYFYNRSTGRELLNIANITGEPRLFATMPVIYLALVVSYFSCDTSYSVL